MDELTQLLAPDPDQPADAQLRLLRGKVTAATATTVTFHLGDPGKTQTGAYHAHTATPAVGDVVSVLAGGGTVLVLGKLR